MRISLNFALATCLIVLACGQALAETTTCAKIKADIRHVQSRMRAGYTAKQGVRLSARLRKLRERRARECR